VTRRVHDRLGADIPAGAGAVLTHERLPAMVGPPLSDQARGDVDAATGREAGDDFRRPRRIIERGRQSRQGGCRDERASEFEEIPAKKKFHVERPLLVEAYPNCRGPSKGRPRITLVRPVTAAWGHA